ncbi:hypothetical protein SDC9_102139 [bioreactor metagenome]|uniref:Uncharacterized protein n=1 Tax=bioreactor metagenome TaxID=1076179 RepID=A0A645AQ02_9ZZZZ
MLGQVFKDRRRGGHRVGRVKLQASRQGPQGQRLVAGDDHVAGMGAAHMVKARLNGPVAGLQRLHIHIDQVGLQRLFKHSARAVDRHRKQPQGRAHRHAARGFCAAQQLGDPRHVQRDGARIIRLHALVAEDEALRLQVTPVDGHGFFIQGDDAVQLGVVGLGREFTEAHQRKVVPSADARHQVTYGKHTAASRLQQRLQRVDRSVNALPGGTAD